MTISFSGPSSGIDTTAWVDALVKMKQASITSMETKKQTLEATTSILDNVKSFFASFKSVISNVTQSNLGIASLDLFIQNLVETSNAEVVTASVTTEAQENNYEVYVDQVATETQAESVFFTNIVSTTETIATFNSLLSSIGIGTGQVGFNVGGVQRVITLQSNDTIASFLDKLAKIGVDASYDQNQGYFSINLGLEDINDDLDGDGIDNTGIKQALFLTNVNSGYSSDVLELSSLETLLIKATEQATMSVFGITEGEYTITDSEGNETIFSANVDGTFREFFDAIEQFGLHASFDAEGVISITTTDGYLISGALAEQLGIVIDDQSQKTDTKSASTIGVFSTEVNNADYTSSLEEIGAMVFDSDTLQILDVNNNLIEEINTLTKSSTVDDLFYTLSQYGISGSLNNSVITLESMNGNIIGGKIAENLGIDTYQTSTTTIKTGESTTSTTMVSYVASATDWVSDCLWDVWDSYSDADKVLTVTHRDRVRDNDDNVTIQTYTFNVIAKNAIAADGSVQKGTQFQDIIDWYKSIDPTATLEFNDNGQIFIDSNDGYYFEGKIAQYLGIGGYTETYTWTEGITTTSSSDTVSYRVRKTDYMSDVLWDNGWLSFSAEDKVISAYSFTVDHTSAIQSTTNPNYTTVSGDGTHDEYTANGNTEGNYVETGDPAYNGQANYTGNASTYQHTVQTLIGTFTIKQGETTFEDFGYWFTHVIDQTAAFTINNDGTLSIDSDNTIHLEGRAIESLGLGISTVAQSWTTGLEETISTGSVTYAAKMTDYISDTFTDAQWAEVNKKISVYSNTIDHYAGEDGNGVYQVTIQTKLTDIILDEYTTFNDLRDALEPYEIYLSMNEGVITFDSAASNYLVEEVYQDITIQNGVTVLVGRTSSSDGSTSVIDHFGITQDLVHQSWTTGTASTESTAVVNYIVKGSDYMSDSFRASDWASLASYTDSSGVSHGGKDIAIMHSYLDHNAQRTVIECKTVITITENTKFGNMTNTAENDSAHSTIIINGTTVAGKTLADVLHELGASDSRNGIEMGITDGVITLDSNCYWIEGSIPNHYGIKVDSVTQNWTTGIATTQSTGPVKFNSSMTDYVSDTFTANEWANLANYTDTAGNSNGGKTIAVMHVDLDHENQRTVITRATSIAIDTNTTFQDLADQLANYGITLTITNGVVQLDSDPEAAQHNGLFYIEGSIPAHWGTTFNTITSSWTTGIATTQSTATVSYNVKMTDYIFDTMGMTRWHELSDYTDNAGVQHDGREIAIMTEYLDHNTHQVVTVNAANITVGAEITFQGLADQLANYGITLNINNGVVTMDSTQSGDTLYYVQGRIPEYYGITYNSTTQNWTTGAEMTKSSGRVSYNADMDDLIKNMYTDSEWASTNKVITFTGQTYDTDDKVAKDTVFYTITVQDSWTLNDLSNAMRAMSDPMALNVTNGQVYASGWMRMEGDIANKLGIRYENLTQTWTVGNTVTSSTGITYNSDNDDRVRDLFTANEWSGVNKTLTIKDMGYNFDTHSTYTNNVGTINVTDDMTISGLSSALSAYGISLSVSNGVVSLNSNRQGCWVEGAIADRMGLSYNTQTLTHTIGLDMTSENAVTYEAKENDTLYEYLYGRWNNLSKNYTIMQSQIDYSTGNVVENQRAVLSVSDTTTFGDLKNTLANYNITMDMSSTGTIFFSGSNNYYVKGDIPEALGAKTTTNSATLTYATSATSTEALKFTGVSMDDKVSDTVGWENLSDKNLYYVWQYIDIPSGSFKYVTKTIDTTNKTWGQLSDALKEGIGSVSDYNSITISGDSVFLDGNHWDGNPYESFYVTGQFADMIGWTTSTQTLTAKVAKTVTGSQLIATANLNTKMTDCGLSSDDYVDIYKHNALSDNTLVKSISVGNKTFGEFLNDCNISNGMNCTINSDGELSFSGTNGYYAYVSIGFWTKERMVIGGGPSAQIVYIPQPMVNGANTTTTSIIDSTVYETGKITYQTTIVSGTCSTVTVTTTTTTTVTTGGTVVESGDKTQLCNYATGAFNSNYTLKIGIEKANDTSWKITITIKGTESHYDIIDAGHDLYQYGDSAITQDGQIILDLLDEYNITTVIESNTGTGNYFNYDGNHRFIAEYGARTPSSTSVTTTTTTTTSVTNSLTTTVETRTLDDWAWNNVKVKDLSFNGGALEYKCYQDNGTGGIKEFTTRSGFSQDMTLSEWNNYNYGTISRNGSKIRITTSGGGNGNYYISSGLNTGFTKVSETTVGREVYVNTVRDTRAFRHTADENTKLSELNSAWNDSTTLTNLLEIKHNPVSYPDIEGVCYEKISCSGSDTIGSLLSKLRNDYGMNAYISDGKITIGPNPTNGTDGYNNWQQWYVRNGSSALSYLGLPSDQNSWIRNQVVTTTHNNYTSKNIQQYITSNNIGRATLGTMGYGSQTFVKSTHNDGSNPGSVSSNDISWSSNESLSTFLQRLRDNGFSASLDSSTHKVTVSSNSPYSYYLGFIGVNNPLKLSSPITSKTVNLKSASGWDYAYCTLNARTTAGDLDGSNIYFDVNVLKDDQYTQSFTTENGDSITGVYSLSTYTWNRDQSLQDFVNQFNNGNWAQQYGFSVSFNESTGKFTFHGSNRAWLYTGGATGSCHAPTLLDLCSSAYRTETYTIVTEADSDKTDLKTYINNNTRLSDLGINSAQALNFFFHADPATANTINRTVDGTWNPESHDGRTFHYNYSWDTNETLGDFINELNNSFIGRNHNYGYNDTSHTSFGINGNGQFVITGENGAYIEGIGSSLQSYFKLSNFTSQQVYTIKNFAYSQKNDAQTYINGATRLGDMGLGNQSVTIVRHINNTFVADMSKATNCTETITVNWSTGESFDTFLQRLRNNGITANINTGDRTLELTGGEYYYIKDISSGLANYMKLNTKENGTYGRSYQYTINYRANADNNAEQTYLNERNTKLHNLSINSAQTMTLVVHTHNTFVTDNTKANNVTRTLTVTWNTDETLVDFEKKVNQALYDTYWEGDNLFYNGIPYGKATSSSHFDPYSTVDNTGNYYDLGDEDNTIIESGNGVIESSSVYFQMKFSVDSNTGKWSFTGSEYVYVKDVSSELANAMKIQTKENNTYGTSYQYTINYRANSDNNVDYTYFNERDTKLRNISINSNQTIDIVVHTNNTFAVNQTDAAGYGDSKSEIYNVTKTITVTWTTGQTLAQFEDMVNTKALKAYLDYSQALDANGYSNNISGVTRTVRADSSVLGNSYIQNRINSGNYLVKQEVTVGADGHKVYNNVTYITDTTGYYFDFDVDENSGKWSFTGNEYSYVNRIDSALANYVQVNTKEGNSYGTSYQYTINYRADADSLSKDGLGSRDYVYANERNTMLHNLKRYDSNGNPTSVTADQVMEIVVHTNNTFAQDQTDGLNSITGVTRTTTVTWTQGETLAEFETKVNNHLADFYNQVGTTTHADGTYAITFSVDPENGKWKFTGTEYCYVRGFGDAGDTRDVTTYTSQLETYMNLTGDLKDTDPGTTGGTYGSSYEYDVIYRADADSNNGGANPGAIDFTYLNERNATLNNLSYVDGNGQTISTTQSQTMDIVIHINNTYAQDNTKSEIGQKTRSSGYTIFSTTTVGKTETSSDFVNYYTTVVAGTSNTFGELGINTNSPIEVYDTYANKLGEFSMLSTSTLHEFLNGINNLNSAANARLENGVIKLDSGYITGNVATALGLNVVDYGYETASKSQTSASAIGYHIDALMDSSTSLADLGLSTSSATEVFSASGSKLGEFTLSSDATIGNFISSINTLSTEGNAHIDNGTITLNNGYVTGSIAENLGLTQTITEGFLRSAIATSSSAGISYIATSTATGTTTMAELGFDTSDGKGRISVYDKLGNIVQDINVDSNDTLNSLAQKINNAKYANGTTANMQAAVEGDKVTIANGYITGEVTSALGITTNFEPHSRAEGITVSSSEGVTYTSISDANQSTKLSELGFNTIQSITVHDQYTTAVATLTVADTATLGELVNAINRVEFADGSNAGVSFNESGNRINFERGYITGDVAERLGITRDTILHNYTTALVVESTAPVSYITATVETENITLKDLGLENDQELVVVDGSGQNNWTTAVSDTTTIGDLVSIINTSTSSTASINEYQGLSINNGYITGSIATALNFHKENTPYDHEVADDIISTTPVFIPGTTVTIDSTTTLGQLDVNSIVGIGVNDATYILFDYQTITEAFESTGLFDVSINNGIVTIHSKSEDNYITSMDNDIRYALNIYNVPYHHNRPEQNWHGYSDAITLDNTVYINEDTTLGDLGITGPEAFMINNKDIILLQTDDSIVKTIRDTNLFNVDIVNGKIMITSKSGDNYITSMSSDMMNRLNLDIRENISYKNVEETWHNCASGDIKVYNTINANNDTTLENLGLGQEGDETITLNNGSIITLSSNDSIAQVLEDTNLFDVDFNNDGIISISCKTDNIYITEMSSNLQSKLNINHVGEGYTYNIINDNWYSSSSNDLKAYNTMNLNNNTKFQDLGLSGNTTIYVGSTGSEATKAITINNTDNVFEKFNSAGFNLTVNSKGVVEISSKNGSTYISDMNSDLAEALKVTTGENSTWKNVQSNTYSSTQSNQITVSVSKTLAADTTLNDLGIGNQTFVRTHTVVNNGTVKSIDTTFTIKSTDSIATKLSDAGFNVSVNAGKITISDNNNNYYIKSMSADLEDILNINVGEGYTYTTSHPFGSSNSSSLKASVYQSINEDTTLANLGLSSASFVLNTGRTVNINAQSKIMSVLRSAGLGVSAVNGKLSISGDSSIYMTNMSSNLKNVLKVDVGEGYTWERFVDESVANGEISAVTRTITVTWTYGALGTEDEDAKPETLAQYLADINTSLAQATTQYKELFNLSEDFTISASVDGEGKFHFTGDEYTYVSRVDDFLAKALKIDTVGKECYLDSNGNMIDKDGNVTTNTALAQKTYGKSYSYDVEYANNSNNQTQYTYINYDNMRLQNFDVYEDQYITIVTHNNTTFAADHTDDQIVKNGTVLFDNTTTTYVITWTAGSTGHTLNNNGSYNNNNNAITDGETFEELKYELEHFGIINGLATEASAVLGNDIYKINVTINADNTISLVGNEYTYIYGISDKLQEKFKIQGREGEGYYYSTYDYDINFNNDGYTKQNTTLLNYDTRLDNLSIMADMTMTLHTPDGGKSIVFDHDTTMQEIRNRLFNDYGIEVTIEDKTGRITFTPTLTNEGYYIVGMDTELKNGLKIITGEKDTYTLDSEQIIATNQAGVYTTTTYTNVTTTAGTFETSRINNYDNTASRDLRFEDDDNIIKMSTRISRLNGYDNGNGNITVHYADGLEQNISIRESMSIGQLCDILQDYGVTAEILAGGRVTFKSNDGTYVKSAENGSNLLEVLNMSDVSIKVEGTTVITSKTLERQEEKESKYFATEETLLSTYAEGLLEANGVITFALNGKYKSVTITSDDTFGTLIDKFKQKGLNAKIEAGLFSISSGFDTFSIIQGGTTSNLSAIIQLNEKQDLGGYAMTDRSKTIMSTTTITDTKSLSVINFADESTQLSTFDIDGGTLSLYADGKKAGITISSSYTIADLQREFRQALGQDVNGSDDENVTVKYKDGYLRIEQKDTNLIIGSNEDTSNFVAITGIFSNNGAVESTRQFFKANENTRIVESGIFRNGDVTVGDFVIGDATITIDETTTIGELASQINTNPDSNVTAYWDNINGKYKITSKNTGNFYINFESGSSNFTDILGFTKTSYDSGTNVTTTSINTAVQERGKNAKVRINGASYTSVTNTLGSDVTSIKGLTINLKGMSAGEATILSVKKDVQSLALAVSDVVDAYNALIDNINIALSSKSELQNDSELKRLRNHIKSIMTGTNKNSSIFKNILSIGIVTNTADPTNLTVGSGIYKLTLDYEKFAKAFETDSESVRRLLIGRVDEDGNLVEEGILTRLEALIDETVEAAGGYFERTEESFDRQISRLDNKIAKGNEAIEKYRERLEKKYMSMNIFNSNIQTQYQVYFK